MKKKNRNEIERKMEHRKQLEIKQGDQIESAAETIWGWDTAAGKVRVNRRVTEILDRVENYTKAGILELGAGAGVFTQQFRNKDANVISIDISHTLVKKAIMKDGVTKAVVGDVEGMPFPDESFDAVIGVSILHHLDIVRALKEIKRVVKKGGTIIFSEPNLANPHNFLQFKIRWLGKRLNVLPTEMAFYRRKLRSTLEKSGFRDVIVQPFDFLHPVTPDFAIRAVDRTGRFLEGVPVVKEISGSLFIHAKK